MMGLGFWAGLFPGAALALFAIYLLAAEVAPGSLPGPSRRDGRRARSRWYS